MGMTVIEKILAHHSTYDVVRPGEIINVHIDLRVSRDLGGINIVKQFQKHELSLDNRERTFFTFDYYPSVADASIFENQQICRSFAREQGIRLFDIHSGIGSHLMIDQGYATPGTILASTDTHANILGAIGALGIGLSEKDIITVFTKGSIWYRVPKSIKINLTGLLPTKTTAKDIALNLLSLIGPSKLLGYAIELYGPAIDMLGLDGRITLASMANEIGAVTFLMHPNQEVIDYCSCKSNQTFQVFLPDEDADYDDFLNIDVSKFEQMISLPGNMEIVPIEKTANQGIDSAFIGTCTNGRIEDLRIAAGILKDRKVAPGVILKIVPSTDEIWTLALQEGLIDIFKESGAMVTNAGCGGCASGQYSHNSFGEVTISTGNKNYAGQTSKGEVYLASPAIVAASAIAGYITIPEQIPDKHFTLFSFPNQKVSTSNISSPEKMTLLEGKTWYIPFDNIDTDMIYHSRYTGLTDLSKFGNYTFMDLEGYEYFADQVSPGDIIIVGQNFGLGNSSHHAVDCFKSLGIQAIIAKSFAVVYEHNAISAGLPVIVCSKTDSLELQSGDMIRVNLQTGIISNLRNNLITTVEKYSGIEIKSSIKEIS
jgi:homoaconitase/3-isopropylmalate dehydratase large subunit/3-isopropylmalate dehydratase small subunit